MITEPEPSFRYLRLLYTLFLIYGQLLYQKASEVERDIGMWLETAIMSPPQVNVMMNSFYWCSRALRNILQHINLALCDFFAEIGRPRMPELRATQLVSARC